MKKLKRYKALKIASCIVGVLLILTIANFIPSFCIESPGMNKLQGEYITVYYEKEEAAAKDVFKLAEDESERIAAKLGFTSSQDVKLYVYDNQGTLQMKKYGLVVLFLNLFVDLDWYIGDNMGTNVILTSPANPGNAHDYQSIKASAVHEMVHAYNSLLNPNMSLWVTEGMAVYLTAGQEPRENLYTTSYFVPTIEQTHTNSPIEFADIGGYAFAYTYIEYLDSVFGWEKLLAYAKTNNFVSAFGKDEGNIYDGWIEFLQENYS